MSDEPGPGADDSWTLVQREEAEPDADVVKSKEAPNPAPKSPPARKPQGVKKQEPAPTTAEVLKAKLVFCLLCCVDSAIKMGAAATQVARRVGAAGAGLLRKAELALQPLAESARCCAAQYAALLRQRDVRGAAKLAGRHASEAAVRVGQACTWAAKAVHAALDSAFQPQTRTLAPALSGATTPSARPAAHTTSLCTSLCGRASKLLQRVLGAAHAAYVVVDPERKLAAVASCARTVPTPVYLMLATGAVVLGTSVALVALMVWALAALKLCG